MRQSVCNIWSSSELEVNSCSVAFGKRERRSHHGLFIPHVLIFKIVWQPLNFCLTMLGLVWVRSSLDYAFTTTPSAWDHFCLGHLQFTREQMRVITHNSGTIKSVLLTDAGGKLVGWQKMPACWRLGTVSGRIKGLPNNCDRAVIIGKSLCPGLLQTPEHHYRTIRSNLVGKKV